MLAGGCPSIRRRGVRYSGVGRWVVEDCQSSLNVGGGKENELGMTITSHHVTWRLLAWVPNRAGIFQPPTRPSFVFVGTNIE